MSSNHERLTRKDLALALPIGRIPNSYSIVRAPQLNRDETYTPLFNSNYGNPQHRHIYLGKKSTPLFHKAHIIVNGSLFGQLKDGDTIAGDLSWKASELAGDDEYKAAELDERMRAVSHEYVDIREQKMIRYAKKLGGALARRSAYVVGADQSYFWKTSMTDLYMAPAVGMTTIRNGSSIVIEPVVEGLSGIRGLMPENTHAFNGLYVPTDSSEE